MAFVWRDNNFNRVGHLIIMFKNKKNKFYKDKRNYQSEFFGNIIEIVIINEIKLENHGSKVGYRFGNFFLE